MGVSDRGFSVPWLGSTMTGVFPDSLTIELPINTNCRGSFSLFLMRTSCVVVKPTSEFLMTRMVGTNTTSGSRTKPTTSTFITRLYTGIMNFH